MTRVDAEKYNPTINKRRSIIPNRTLVNPNGIYMYIVISLECNGDGGMWMLFACQFAVADRAQLIRRAASASAYTKCCLLHTCSLVLLIGIRSECSEPTEWRVMCMYVFCVWNDRSYDLNCDWKWRNVCTAFAATCAIDIRFSIIHSYCSCLMRTARHQKHWHVIWHAILHTSQGVAFAPAYAAHAIKRLM